MPQQLSEVKKRELETNLAAYIKCMEKNAESMRNVPMPELSEPLFSLFETTGNRLLYENVYFQRRKYLSVYGCLAILRENPDDAVKLEEVVRGICEEECWALPAHVDRAKNPAWRKTVDLFASETGGLFMVFPGKRRWVDEGKGDAGFLWSHAECFKVTFSNITDVFRREVSEISFLAKNGIF
ncbi:MAG: hypothetical protein LUH00_01060 [Lachnospiraceae bacterium]|nr:hypothetical protein [Lachnospiraceae bacterium]